MKLNREMIWHTDEDESEWLASVTQLGNSIQIEIGGVDTVDCFTDFYKAVEWTENYLRGMDV